MADKDIGERDAIKQCLPDTRVLICLFHTLRSLQREVSCSKMGITGGQRSLCPELLQKMAYASSEEEYEELHTQLATDAPNEIVKYFDTN